MRATAPHSLTWLRALNVPTPGTARSARYCAASSNHSGSVIELTPQHRPSGRSPWTVPRSLPSTSRLLEPPVHAARSARGGPRSVSSARRQLPATAVGTVLDAHTQRLEPLSHLVGSLEIAPLTSQLPLFEDQADGALERSAGVVVRDPGSGWHAEYPFEEVVEQRRGSSTVLRSRA